MKTLYILIKALPEILSLIKRLEKRSEKQTKKMRAQKIKHDLKEIEKAFDNGDADSLNDIFNS